MNRPAAWTLGAWLLLPACLHPGQPGAAASARKSWYVAEEEMGLIGLQCGDRVVANEHGAHFTLDLRGDRVMSKPLDQHRKSWVLDIDGLLVAVGVVPAAALSPEGNQRGMDLLRAYQAGQIASLSKRIGVPVSPVDDAAGVPDRAAAGLLWHVDFPAGTVRPGATSKVFATREVAGNAVVLSVQGFRDEPIADLLQHARGWISTLATSTRAISYDEVAMAVQHDFSDRDPCRDLGRNPPRTGDPWSRLREGDVDRGMYGEPAAAIGARWTAAALGGFERRLVDGLRQYTNFVCGLEITYPPGWSDVAVHDYNGRECLLDLATPKMRDADGRESTGSIGISVALVEKAGGTQKRHATMSKPMADRGATFEQVTPPLIPGALHRRYHVAKAGKPVEGDLITFEQGVHVYHLDLAASPGTYARAREHLLQLLESARWDVRPYWARE